MQTTAIGTVANSLPENEVILLTLLISKRYILYADLRKIFTGFVVFYAKKIFLNKKLQIRRKYCAKIFLLARQTQ